MTNKNDEMEAGLADDSRPINDAELEPFQAAQPAEDIVSVNKKGSAGDNKVGKAIFVLVMGSVLVGALTWFGQSWLDGKKADMRAASAPKAGEPAPNLFNPEKTGSIPPKPKLGAESGFTPPSAPVAEVKPEPGDCVRPLRGADGKPIFDAQGRAMAVDCDGKVMSVPAISTVSNEKTPLPGSGNGQGQGGQAQPKPPSRYGGALFVTSDAAAVRASAAAAALNPATGSTESFASTGARPPVRAPSATPFPGQPAGVVYDPNEASQPRTGTVGSALYSSATPVAVAKRFGNQNLMLPKGRQADCILTGRIVDEVPGFTSCALAADLYSSNGRVLLLERGSELTGEYGVTNQLGSERLFVTWNRVKTPAGIEVDLSSPGSDRLGTSGLPGHLDNRWGERIASALLISLVKDISVAAINNRSASSGNNNVTVGQSGQNTATTSGQLAEEVIKQTLKVRPRLTINEGTRIAIYVARDLDFSQVYALREAGTGGITRLLSQ